MFRCDAHGHRGEVGVKGALEEGHGVGDAREGPTWEEGAAWQAKWGDRARVPGKGGPGGAKGDLGGLEVELLYEDELELQLASY